MAEIESMTPGCGPCSRAPGCWAAGAGTRVPGAAGAQGTEHGGTGSQRHRDREGGYGHVGSSVGRQEGGYLYETGLCKTHIYPVLDI